MKSTNNLSASTLDMSPYSIPAQGVYVRWLHTYLQRIQTPHNVFACSGCTIEKFQSEIEALREIGWKEIAHPGDELTASCLLIEVGNSAVVELESAIDRHPHVQLVMLCAEHGVKKTPSLGMLERQGFRVLRERNNVTFLAKIGMRIDTLATGLQLGDHEIKSALQKSWRRIRNFPAETVVELLAVEAPLLLVPDRFDIAIKAMYARLWRAGRAQLWRDYAYFEHVLRITGPSTEIAEHDGSGKCGVHQFKEAYHRLIAELDPTSIPVLPADTNWCVFDGAHRVAAAIAMNRDVLIARIEETSKSRANAEFFSGNKHGHPPCPVEILDEAAIEYCRVKDGLVLALIFPRVVSTDYAIEQLKKMGNIVYRKDVFLSPEAAMGLLRQAYLGHAWVEESGEDAGFSHKVRSCFPHGGTVRVILLDDCDPSYIRPTKESIRLYYAIGNHSIHLTDGDDEVLRLARVLFNKNSIELLELGLGVLPGFHSKLFAYRDWLEGHGLDGESFCIDGSAVLSLLGLRECRDLDFLYHGDPGNLPETPERIDCHNQIAHYHRNRIGDLVGDPRLHCWYMGVKFCTPRIVLEMKEQRCEGKDMDDAAILRSRLSLDKPFLLKVLRLQLMRVHANLRARLFIIINRLKAPLRPIVRAVQKIRHKK